MKKIGLLFIIMIMGSLFLGCLSVPEDGIPEITIINQTGYLGYELYISPVTSDVWGEDVLGNQVLRDGASFRLKLDDPLRRSNRYDFRLIDLDGDSYEIRNMAITHNSVITFRFNHIVRR
ncbi:MAG: hypothetical protein FWC01_08650 [Treponema sp.]|nr:hypothetical protein [Treponema sp.]MCL2238025.1 hypothetical protein [Treponema sp.]